MRWSQLRRHELINLQDGTNLGVVGTGDLVLDESTGAIQGLVVRRRGLFEFLGSGRETVVPWEAVERIGPEFLLVRVNPFRPGD